MNTSIQIEAMNKGLSYKGLFLLLYIRDNFFLDTFVGANIQNNYPIIFKSSADVKQAFDELVSAKAISGEYIRGKIVNCAIDVEVFKDILEEKKVVIKKEKVEKVSSPETDIDAVEVIKYYNSFPELPRPSANSDLNRAIVRKKIDEFGLPAIMEAITFASTSWVLNKASERWMNLKWIMINIDRFVEGGKYRNGAGAEPVVQYDFEDDNEVVL